MKCEKGDAMGRPSGESSLLNVLDARFFPGKASSAENALASGAPAVELALRCALSAPSYGLRRASLRASSTNSEQPHRKNKTQKGDISILVRRGTFLFWFDIG